MTDISELIHKFSKIDLTDFPDFNNYEKVLDKGLWVLWVTKEKLGIKRLTSEQIASITREVMEFGIDAKSISKSFNRAGNKIYSYLVDGEIYYEIMIPGKDYLRSRKQGLIEVFYFQPGRRYTSKRTLGTKILNGLRGELRIVDPYCDERTLDIIRELKGKTVYFLTQIKNMKKNVKKYQRELKDFKIENPTIEFRDYPQKDIHDRYIISTDQIVILGHSIKNLGEKESFAIILDRNTNKSIFESLTDNFDSRWKVSSPI